MKRYLMTILAAVLTTLTLKAMPYEMAREEAMYLTDKMAYELNLNQRQYEYAYEINLDYLMGLDRAEDAYGLLLRYRNDDLRHILYDWQWNLFATVDYFFRPVTWRFGRWFYPIYGHYARNYYFYSRPAVYHNYRGGHGHSHFTNGFYVDRRPRWDGGFRGADRGHITRQPNMGGHAGGQFNMGNRGEMNHGQQPNMGNRGEVNRGQQPNMGNRGEMNRGQQPNMGNRGEMNRGQQPNMGNHGEMNRGQQPNMGNRGEMNRGQGMPNMGNRSTGNTRTTTPSMGNTRTTGPSMGGANRGSSMGNVSAGRGHR